jgi:hypothetical protein
MSSMMKKINLAAGVANFLAAGMQLIPPGHIFMAMINVLLGAYFISRAFPGEVKAEEAKVEAVVNNADAALAKYNAEVKADLAKAEAVVTAEVNKVEGAPQSIEAAIQEELKKA